MKMKRWAILLIAAILGVGTLAVGEKPSVVGEVGMVSSAHARVGRPLTPVSVAGVARRTARRCAAGVYYC